MPEINDGEPDDLEPPGKPDAGTELDDTDPEGVDDTTPDNWDADGEFDSDEGESDVADDFDDDETVGAANEVTPAEGKDVPEHLDLSPVDSWGRQDTLDDHYERHGADFGATSQDEYAHQASDFLQRSQREQLDTKIDDRGAIRIYDQNTNEFGSYNADGTTRTYFAPDPAEHGLATNADYWDGQKGNKPWTP